MLFFGFGRGLSCPAGRAARLFAAATVVAPWGAAPAMAAASATAPGTVNAMVIRPLTLTHNKTGDNDGDADDRGALDFGQFTSGTGGSVTVTSSGAGSTRGDVAFVPGSSTSADGFTVQGDGGRSFAIVSGPGSVSNGTANMGFTTQSNASSSFLNSGGWGGFNVGGTLTVPPAVPVGSYSGTYKVTVSYN